MPRPKPAAPLRERCVRIADPEWQKFQEMGGPAWLRRFLGSRPPRYFEVFKRPKT